MSKLQMKLPKKYEKLSSSKLIGKIWVVDSTPNQGVKVKHDSQNPVEAAAETTTEAAVVAATAEATGAAA